MRKAGWVCLAAALFALAACQSTPPKPTPQPVAKAKTQAVKGKVFVTEQTLPKGSYEIIGPVKGVDMWYGNEKDAYEILANKGRDLGADAVIEVKIWLQPGGLAWAAPAGEGLAVRVKDKAVLKGVVGRWK